MTEESKAHLMQAIYKLAAHYEIPNAEAVPFKKRSVLLELINAKNEEAFKLMSTVVDLAMRKDRIENDKEKQEKKLEHWTEEIAAVQALKLKAIDNLLQFFKKEKISAVDLSLES